MKTVVHCYWRIPTETSPGKTHVTRWKMSREEALKRHPTAVEAGGHEVRVVPETPAEHAERLRSMSVAPPATPSRPPLAQD